LHVAVLRKKVMEIENIILDMDQEAFITAEDVKPLRRGFWRA
jgi:uncharacterized protein YebE (UPF0316 family)